MALVRKRFVLLFAGLLCGTGCVPAPPGADEEAAQAQVGRMAQAGAWVVAAADTQAATTKPVASTIHPSVAHAATALATEFHFELVVIGPDEADWNSDQVVVGDVNGDSRPDVVETLSESGSGGHLLVRVHAQQADGTLAAPIEFALTNGTNFGHGLELGDLDGNGVSDILVGDDKGLTTARWFGSEFGIDFHPGTVRNMYLAATDADGDGSQDVYAQSWSEGVDIYRGDGRGGITAVSHEASAAAGYNTVETSDFTGDGHDDVVTSNWQGWPLVWVRPAKPGQGLQPVIEIDLRPALSLPPGGMTVADMNRDGRPDLVVSDQGDHWDAPEGIRIFYRGDGNTFSRTLLLPLPAGFDRPGAVAVADLDGNLYPDIVVMMSLGLHMGYFLQDHAGFDQGTLQPTGELIGSGSYYEDNSFAIADVNSDRCPDVVLAELSSSLRIFYGRNCHPPRLTGGPGQIVGLP